MGGSLVLTHSQHTVQCASKYNLELKETEIFLKMIPLLISINVIPHGLLEGFLGRKRNVRRNPSSWHYYMMFPDSKNMIFIKFLLHPNLVLNVRKSRNF